LLAQFELTDAGRRRVGTYSGGMRRRLELAASLAGHPSVIFLDEPSTGLRSPRRAGHAVGVLLLFVAAVCCSAAAPLRNPVAARRRDPDGHRA
jgi:ABC-type transporter Mla maintaining outer membrane lipid asymmetry ATPase subunit MlaF